MSIGVDISPPKCRQAWLAAMGPRDRRSPPPFHYPYIPHPTNPNPPPTASTPNLVTYPAGDTGGNPNPEEQGFAGVHAKLDAGFARLQWTLDVGFASLHAKLDAGF